MTQQSNLGNSLYRLKSHFSGLGSAGHWSARATLPDQPTDFPELPRTWTWASPAASGTSLMVLSPWAAWLAETAWKERDLQLVHVIQKGRECNRSSKFMLKHKKVAIHHEKRGGLVLAFNIYVLMLVPKSELHQFPGKDLDLEHPNVCSGDA